MRCVKCGAVFPNNAAIKFCPECGSSLKEASMVSGDTKVGWQGLGTEKNDEKTVLLNRSGSKTAPLPGPYTEMKTNPQMDFSPEDFEQYDNFDVYDDDELGIERPNPCQPLNNEPVDDYDMDDGRSDDYGMDDSRSDGYDMDDSSACKPEKNEKYFPHGFLEEHPDIEPVRRGQKFGVLDVFATLFGLIVMGIAVYVLKMSQGWTLLRQFIGGDMENALSNMDDIRYFAQNPELTWRLYYELAAIVTIMSIVMSFFIIVHCYVKNQAIGIIKAVLLLMGAFGQAALCAGYFYYYLVTVRTGLLIDAGAAGFVTLAGIVFLAVAFIWFICMLLWGLTSFFKGFPAGVLVLLIIGSLLSLVLIAFNLAVTYKVAYAIMPKDALIQMMSTPVMMAAFMLLTIFAAAEDYRAKQIVDLHREV